MEGNKTVTVNMDEYANIQIVMQATGKDEPASVTALMEIGLYNILNYPTGIKKVDDILKENQWQEVVKRMKEMWGITR